MNEPTTCSVLTASARGAVAVIEVRGPQRASMLDTTFHAASGRTLDKQPVGAIRYGKWRSTGEDVVVVKHADAIEVHCHGGRAVVAAVIDSLVNAGCQQVEPWHNNTIEQAAARALASAPTQRCAQILCDQWQGALARELREIANEQDASTMIARLETIVRFAPLGQHLVEPWHVVLAGAPNVGKSSLINALLGYERALVFDQPGTTRDVVTATTALGGWPVLLCDTAGLRDTHDPLEQAGVALARERLATADVVILVEQASAVVASVQQTCDDIHAWRALAHPQAKVLVAVSQCDRADDDVLTPKCLELQCLLDCLLLQTSSKTGLGLDVLADAIVNLLVFDAPSPGAAVPFTREQQTMIEQAITAARSGDVLAARKVVEGMTSAAR